MTATLLFSPPTPAAPVALVTCDRCGEGFPERETEFHEPSERLLCLDDLDAVLARADDQRNADNYFYG